MPSINNMLCQHFFCKNDFFLLKILFYRFRLIINLIERKQAMIKKIQRRKTAGCNRRTQSRSNHCSNYNTTGVGRTAVKTWLKNAGLTANRKWKVDEIQA